MVNSRPGYNVRAPIADDLDAVADVLVADQRHAGGQPVLGADFIASIWSRPSFELATDGWVVSESAGRIVAYGQVTREVPGVVESWGVVHPQHRGRGIGSWMLDRIEQRARKLLAGIPSPRFRHAINARDRAAAKMLRGRGLEPVRHFWHMQIDLIRPSAAGPPPAGIEISGIGAAVDIRAVHTVLEEAFAEGWDHHPRLFDRWAEEEASNPRYDPSLWLVARDAEKPVGALTASIASDGGWVDSLAVLGPYRGRGIGATLLQRSFALLASRGLRRVILNVDTQNPTGATALYERQGMQVAQGWDLWERTANLT
jgi:mycothiol synthase